MEKVIEVKNVTKRYKLFDDSKEKFLSLFNRENYGKDFYALDQVNFSAYEGDVVGFIGTNGSGKSTLSNIIAGIVPETSGDIKTRGEVALIAVSAGLNNNLSGRENIELKCLMLGFTKREIEELEPEIIEFSELVEFIDQPVKSYSSGMKSRLGFAISVSVDPDILIIDEALSVGDKAFAEKSLQKMKDFKAQGKTMIFVSHSLGQMKQFCDKILWLEFGRVKAYGEADEVLGMYEKFLNKWQKMSKKERDDYRKNVLSTPVQTEAISKYEDTLVYSTTDEFIDESDDYEIHLESRLAHIRGGKSYVYEAPNNQGANKPSDKLKNKVYYVKRSASYRFEKFYLLSTKPSGEEGLIGWMKETDLQTHVTTFVDKDKKTFKLNGKGSAYNTPWGGKKQLVFDDLSDMKNETIVVEETWFIGTNTWCKGYLKENLIWINAKYVYQ
ncbi:teichoic acids export ABC transporter ATP-binding subunit TagH [Nosocomiicoccus ampullae]|uniref:teichoic acids export ABC transporter ATP-binding subunit TagH n=1 Tax=Nosocomiicoccus ampullae TaxID=489910 RepID=UPI001C5DFF23|nr:teichoic acids export ABC transporter ATP-binding subunit TagH [Nosocomiicoccus ampullae]